MEGKDNRSREKRVKMRQSKQQFHRKPAGGGTNSSSSVQEPATTMSGIVDIVDSSDEHYVARRGWKGVLPQTKPRDMLLDDMDMDDEVTSVENAQLRAGDFKIMAQMPTSIGGHFKFSSEKHWDTDEVDDIFLNSNASEYFTLNLKLLNAGLKSIPFYKRMDYASSMFTKGQIKKMNKTAEEAEIQYQSILKEHEDNPNPKIKINSANNGRRNDSAKSKGSTKEVKSMETTAPDELDELLSVTTEQVAKVGLSSNIENIAPNASLPPSTAGSVVGNKNDIQEWLDNVLDE